MRFTLARRVLSLTHSATVVIEVDENCVFARGDRGWRCDVVMKHIRGVVVESGLALVDVKCPSAEQPALGDDHSILALLGNLDIGSGRGDEGLAGNREYLSSPQTPYRDVGPQLCPPDCLRFLIRELTEITAMGRYRKSHPIRQPLPRIEKKSVLPLGPIVVLIAFVLGSGVYLRFSSHMSRSGRPELQPSAVDAASDDSVGRFEKTVENQQPAPGDSPQGMPGSLAANFPWEQTILLIWMRSG